MTDDILRIDHDRMRRTGVPEVVYGEGKPAEVTLAALQELLSGDTPVVLASRVSADAADVIREALPDVRYDERGRIVVARRASPSHRVHGRVALAVAGTSDLDVAYECAGVLDALGVTTDLCVDIGVAGLHRVLEIRDRLDQADVVVAVAGMDGALPTVVVGLVSAPVIGVPTPVGYGVGAGGRAALHTMLSSCAPGLVIVNIGNGVGAALASVRILRAVRRRPPSQYEMS